MRVVAIGRSEILHQAIEAVLAAGHEVVGLATAKEAPEYEISSEDFLRWAHSRHLPAISTSSSSNLAKFCSQLNADIAISVNYPAIIPQHVIDFFPLGILNAHGGDLPRYRGNACQAWAIINGETSIGLCIHRMIGGIVDAGDIIARSYLPIDDQTYVGDCLDWIKTTTPGLFVESLAALQKCPNFCLEQQAEDPSSVLRCFPRRPSDGRIDWKSPAEKIHRLIRASGRPFGGAWAAIDDLRITVWKAQIVVHPTSYLAEPGQVLTIHENAIDVACGEGPDADSRVALRLTVYSVQDSLLEDNFRVRSTRQRLN